MIDGAELVDLGTFGLAGYGHGEGSAVNNSGLLVGSTAGAKLEKGVAPMRAMRWQAGTPVSAKKDLNSLTSAPFPPRRALDVCDAAYFAGWRTATTYTESRLEGSGARVEIELARGAAML